MCIGAGAGEGNEKVARHGGTKYACMHAQCAAPGGMHAGAREYLAFCSFGVGGARAQRAERSKFEMQMKGGREKLRSYWLI